MTCYGYIAKGMSLSRARELVLLSIVRVHSQRSVFLLHVY